MSKDLKFKNVPFRRVLITANEVKTKSGIVLSADQKSTKSISDIQEVIAVGPLVNIESSGIDLVVGDRVLLNILKPDGRPKEKIGYPLFFNKETGKLAEPSDTESTCDMYFMIEASEIVMVLPKEE